MGLKSLGKKVRTRIKERLKTRRPRGRVVKKQVPLSELGRPVETEIIQTAPKTALAAAQKEPVLEPQKSNAKSDVTKTISVDNLDKLKKTQVKVFMVDKPITVKVDAPFSQVADIFGSSNFRHLPVVDEEHILAGLITQRDLYRTLSPRRTLDGDFEYDKSALDKFVLKYIMTKDVVSLHMEDTFSTCVEKIATHKFSGFPIVDDHGKVVGIVTHADIFRFLNGFLSKSPSK